MANIDIYEVTEVMGHGQVEAVPETEVMSLPILTTVGAAGSTPYYKMRTKKDPGPGYVVWLSQNAPDYAGSGAGEAIVAGSAIQTDTWLVQT